MEEIIKQLNYQPTRLSDREIQYPQEIIASFFLNYPIHEARANLWQLYQGWVYHSRDYANSEMIECMMMFYEQLIGFAEASYILAEKANLQA